LTKEQRDAIRQAVRAGQHAEAIQKTENALGVSIAASSAVLEELKQ
jgi:hypothetical protein